MAGAFAAALLIAAPAVVVSTAPPSYADCGDPGEPACTGPVPTVDEVVAILDKLTDPDIPAVDKGDIVTPGFTPEEAGEIDDHLNRMLVSSGGCSPMLPARFIVTDIEAAPNNFAGATVSIPHGVRSTPRGPIVLVDQGGHWLITHDTAMTALDAIWYNATRYIMHGKRIVVC
ncbi:hypothetical protein KIH27_20430 [Mycobacterium sp. M1]|uniref:Low molecular weight antigen MTB12-like C-terminal domain-containing protein n=1 Tax=Mycolicibacter acidiphilus TaxID=2835306 RepID=A0ABS5RSL7_9MYCO|nr:hypothetical protein [Mycolicibacter acidiphilus]MBS9535954.1 hypothetical protein [Mycolicibacter acidiphilus]